MERAAVPLDVAPDVPPDDDGEPDPEPEVLVPLPRPDPVVVVVADPAGDFPSEAAVTVVPDFEVVVVVVTQAAAVVVVTGAAVVVVVVGGGATLVTVKVAGEYVEVTVLNPTDTHVGVTVAAPAPAFDGTVNVPLHEPDDGTGIVAETAGTVVTANRMLLCTSSPTPQPEPETETTVPGGPEVGLIENGPRSAADAGAAVDATAPAATTTAPAIAQIHLRGVMPPASRRRAPVAGNRPLIDRFRTIWEPT